MFQRLKALLTRRPRAQLQHPEFGLLTFYSGVWRGQLQRHGKEIRVAVAGSEVAPDPTLFDQLRTRLNRLPQMEQSALEFLCAKKPLFNPRDFTIKSVNFLSPDKPDIFGMEFSMQGDEDGLWRVEFERDQPKQVERRD